MDIIHSLKNTILVGIDGGASKLSGWIVEFNKDTHLFRLGNLNIQKKYSDYHGYNENFKPVDIKTQLKEMNTQILIAKEEKVQAEIYMKAAADVVIELLQTHKDKNALIGIGMPGLKTKDQRGISAIANGPRMPGYCDFLEDKIYKQGLELVAPIAHLGSDADYCGLGEEYSENGLFRNIDNAYYLGGGTGVADALKLNGKLLRFDHAKPWIAKAWEMKCEKGNTLEQYASASGIQKTYSQYSKISIQDLNRNQIFPIQILEKALKNEKAAYDTINEVGKRLAELLFERITTIYSGWSGIFSFLNPNREMLTSDHEFKGILLESIVIGQRLGDLLLKSQGTRILWPEVLKDLGEMIQKTGENKLIEHYLRNGKFHEEKIQISKLREAPALGAGIDAFISHNKY